MAMKKKETFTSKDLCERYGVTLRTIHAMERKQGFPKGSVFSKALIWSVPMVLAWEHNHMPHLSGSVELADDAEDWKAMKDGKAPEPAPRLNGRPRRKK